MTSKALELGKLAGYVHVDTANDVVEVLGAEVVLSNTGVVAGVYGNTTAIPVLTVDSTGRVTNASTSSVSGVTGLSFNAGNNTVTVSTSTTAFTANIQAGLDQAYTNAVTQSVSQSTTQAASYTDAKASNAYANAVAYANTQLALKANLSGATFTGAVVVNNTATLGNTLATSIHTIGNVQIDGDLIVAGNTISVSTSTISIKDNLLYINNGIAATITGISGNGSVVTFTANNNFVAGWDVTVYGVTPSSYNAQYNNILTANATHFTATSTTTDAYVSGGTARGKTDSNPDIGFAAGYNDGTYHHTGFFRDASDGVWKVFDSYVPEPDASVYIDTTHASFRIADIQANVVHAASLSGNANTATTANNSLYLGGQDSAYYSGLSASAYANAVAYANATFAKMSGTTFVGTVAVSNTFAAGNTTITGTVNATANIATAGSITAGNNTIVPIRALTVAGGEMSIIGQGNATPVSFINIHDSTGNLGANSSLNIRGLTANGSAPATLSSITFTATSGFFTGDVYSSYSDINLKTKVSDIDDPIGKLMAIETLIYEPNQTALDLGVLPGRKVGVSAQSVYAVQPEATGPSALGNNYLTVQYERLVPLLIAAIQKQQEQIEALKERLGE